MRTFLGEGRTCLPTPHKKTLACAGSWEEASVHEAQRLGTGREGVGRVGTKAAVSAELGFEEFLFTNESLCEIVEFWGRG